MLYFIAGIIGGICGIGAGYYIAGKIREKRLKEAKKTAEDIILEAKKEAERIKEAAKTEVRIEKSKIKETLQKEKEKMFKEFEEKEKNLRTKEIEIERKADIIARKEHEIRNKEKSIEEKERSLKAKHEELDRRLREANEQLQRISGMTKEEAKKILMENLLEEARLEAAQKIKEIKEKAEREAEKEAINIISQAIERCAARRTIETTTVTVELPDDALKGRLIGREGRNIRAFDSIFGVDLLIDDTPGVVTISCFDPRRREIARIALERLIRDGRIHPARIEEEAEKAKQEFERRVEEIGKKTVIEAGIKNLHPELVKMIGMLKFRSSYGQNVLEHSVEVMQIASIMAQELGLDVETTKRAALLHDIGKAAGQEYQGKHQEIGAKIAKRFGESEIVVNAIAAHHGDVEPISPIAVIVQAADAISGARPGARRETFEAYIERLQKLEEIVMSFDGVENCYAIQAGREVRVIVQPEKVPDTRLQDMAEEIAKKIEKEMKYPGEIKVVVLRETRAIEFAK